MMNRKTSTPARPGYSLLELLVSVAVMAMVINVCLSTFISMSRMSALSVRGADRIQALGDLRAGFGKTVREAQGVVPNVGQYVTGPERVVLALPGEGEARRYAVFGLVSSPDRIERLEFEERQGQLAPLFARQYPLPVSAARFSCDAGIRMEIDVPDPVKVSLKPPDTYQFVATMRGKVAGGVQP